MHLESTSESPVCVTWRRPPLLGAQASVEPRGGHTSQELRVRSRLRPATSPRRPPPRPERSRPSPAPRPRPRCGGLGGGGSRCRQCRRAHSRLWSFSNCAGGMSSVLFLYWASPCFRGPRERRSPHPLICIGHRPQRHPLGQSLGGQSPELRAAGCRPGCAAPGCVQ